MIEERLSASPIAPTKMMGSMGAVLLPRGVDWMKLQQSLTGLGCSPGTVDGQWGGKTTGAVQQFTTPSKGGLMAMDDFIFYSGALLIDPFVGFRGAGHLLLVVGDVPGPPDELLMPESFEASRVPGRPRALQSALDRLPEVSQLPGFDDRLARLTSCGRSSRLAPTKRMAFFMM